MPTREEFIADVDKFMNVQKLLVGTNNPEWHQGRNEGELAIKFPLEIEGVQYGQQLTLNAYPYEPGTFSISLIHDVAVTRLDVTHDNDAHGNNVLIASDALPSIIYGPHFHRWETNRRLVDYQGKLIKLRLAEPFSGSRKLMSALRWFCSETNIQLEYDAYVELPPKDGLF